MFCSQCGKSLVDVLQVAPDARYCVFCGDAIRRAPSRSMSPLLVNHSGNLGKNSSQTLGTAGSGHSAITASHQTLSSDEKKTSSETDAAWSRLAGSGANQSASGIGMVASGAAGFAAATLKQARRRSDEVFKAPRTSSEQKGSPMPNISSETVIEPVRPAEQILNDPTDDSHVRSDYESRGKYWQQVLKVADFKARFAPTLYEKLLSTPSPFQKKIQKDIHRTFPDHPFFKASYKRRQSLENIVSAYSVYDTVGYSQGMAFIAGFLYLYMSEEDAFWAFVRLMYSPRHNMRELFDGKSETLSLCLREFDNVLQVHRPKMAKHFAEQGVDATMYASQWFLTVFIYRFPLQVLPSIWDMFVGGGILTIFQVGLALLDIHSAELLSANIEALIPWFNKLEELKLDHNLILAAQRVHIDPSKLKHITAVYVFPSL